MTPDRTTTWTLDALVDEAARLIDAAGVHLSDGRVASAPDARSIRYYQSLGLVDRPVRYDGRAAIYGWRSLVQAVAIKLMQGEGHSLAQIQQALASRPFEALEQAVLSAFDAPDAAPAPPPELRTWQLAPGVLLTVDPSLVPDAEGLARRVQQLLTRGGPS